nr:FkbM family methyltransferase [uncultured Rhodopila sp.]
MRFPAIPLSLLYPFRLGAVTWRRGSLPRSACIAVLKWAARGRRPSEILREIKPLDRPDLAFIATGSMVLDAVYWFGVQGYEGQVAAVWQSLCAKASRVLEVGGNVGLFTVVGGRATQGRYTVVEPVPEVAAALRNNLLHNRVANVDVLEAAAIPGDTVGEVILNIPDEGRDSPVGAHLVEGVEIAERSSLRLQTVVGVPFRALMQGCDLIKIDAEGIEMELLQSVRHLIVADRPTLVVEVLPEAERLGTFLATLARDTGYTISVIPEYGSDEIVTVPSKSFNASVPGRHRSKDVVLSMAPLRL